jgi:succinate-semialdehyde dehydrogenase/glutarate-semialdehyde dehydrogenase
MRFTVPALMAGNAVVLKHAPSVQKCAHAIEELMRIAGLPDGIFSNLVIDVDLVEDVIAHPAVQAVIVTGSISTGRRVAAMAGSYLKKVMPELGGSDPFIVLDGADIEVTLDRAVQAKFANAGQSCIAAKRFIVLPEIAESFVQGLVSRVSQLKVGDPLDKDTQIGPMAREDLRDRLHAQVSSTLSAGAVPLIGCQPIAGPGYFYTPSVIDHTPIGTPARQEEIFGPVAVIIRAKDEDDAISIANETQYGLGATIWSRDIARAEYLLSKVQAGMTYVNSIVRSDPLLPFGGIKATGFGRSLSFYSIREFCQTRTVWINNIAK